mgnify:CR=1 FL=1
MTSGPPCMARPPVILVRGRFYEVVRRLLELEAPKKRNGT